LVKVENSDLLADSHSILNRWKNQFCQLLSEHGVNYVRQTETDTAEPLVPGLKLQLKIWKGINHQVLMVFRQNSSRQGVIIHYVLRSTNLLILFGTGRNARAAEGIRVCTAL
jgi:hypothetical protein